MTDVETGKLDNTEKSALDMRDDPFAPRDGKTLTWKDVDMTLVSDVVALLKLSVFIVVRLAWGLGLARLSEAVTMPGSSVC